MIYSAIVLCISCSEDEPEVEVADSFAKPSIIVLNEGNFQTANGSISIHEIENKKTYNKVFQSANSARPLGDVVQSITKFDNRYFIVVNNSNKIEVVDSESFQSLGSIKNLNSQRYILPISATKAYVSDLFEDKIYIINPENLSISGTITSKGWTEEMILVDHKAFVCQVDSNQLYVFDTKADTLLAKINTHLQPQHLEQDANGMLWLSCSGGINNQFPALYQIDPNNLQVNKVLEWPDVSKSIGEIEMNGDGSKLIYLMEDVFEIDINDNSLPTKAKIEANGRLFYALGVHPSTDEIYLSDAIDYLQNGVIYRYSASATEISTFKAGIIPGDFYFQD